MNVATLTLRTDDAGKRYLSGVVRYGLPDGSIVVLRKDDAGEYTLIAASDGSPAGDRSEASLWSFVEPTESRKW